MTILINGENHEFPNEVSHVSQMLESLALGYPVLVELNGKALFEREFPTTTIKNGDKIELLRVAAGG